MTTHDILFLFFVLLQLGDIYTTYRILKCGGRELNPVLSRLFAAVGLLPTLIGIKVLAIAAVWWADSFYLTGLLCVIYAAVIANNANQMRQR